MGGQQESVNDVAGTAGDADRKVSELVAAVDLGSNSFHLIIGRLVSGQVRIVDRVRERVRIAAGLDARGYLAEDARDRAIECLERFGERVRQIEEGRVRAVGTYTFRKARNAPILLRQAEAALGHPIEVVSGREESRLIYLGVVHNNAPSAVRRLVIDIGGGSTEFILGEGGDLLEAESIDMGCVSESRAFFPEGRIDEFSFRRAITASRLELRTQVARLRATGWQRCLGTSGTAHAIQSILRASGDASEPITAAGLARLRETLVEAGHVDRVNLSALGADRRPVLPGGLAILIAAFQSFRIDRMDAVPGGLREGLLYDLVGRLEHEDVRDRTIRRFVDQFQLDEDQGYRVEKTALALLDQVEGDWSLKGHNFRQLLSWAARLHEIGLGISHAGYHKHGEYLINHSELAGFSQDNQRILATLVRGHRGKLGGKRLYAFPHLAKEQGVRICILLRLAVLLNRSRRNTPLPEIRLKVAAARLTMRFPSGWLREHALTSADLEKEAGYLQRWGCELEYGE